MNFFEKVTSTDEEDEASEFIFRGRDGVVTVQKWQLVVHDNKDYHGRIRLNVNFINVKKERHEGDIDVFLGCYWNTEKIFFNLRA